MYLLQLTRVFTKVSVVITKKVQKDTRFLTNCKFSGSSNRMFKPSVYVTREVNSEALDVLNELCDVSFWAGPDPVPRDELLRQIENKHALFCMLTDQIDVEVLDKAGSNLQIIATMSAGYDHLDVQEIKKRNIKISSTPDILTDATAELAVALLLATSRRLFEANEAAKIGKWNAWSPFWMCGQGIKNSTVGIVGFGRIGQEIAKKLKAFNPTQIIYYSRSEKAEIAKEIGATRVSFDELLKQSDFISAIKWNPDAKFIIGIMKMTVRSRRNLILQQESDDEDRRVDIEDENSDTDASVSSFEERKEYSESEQSGSSKSEDEDNATFFISVQRTRNKVNDWKWEKLSLPQRIRKPAQNLLVHLPGVIREAKQANGIYETWNLLTDNTMLREMVECTNKYITNVQEQFSQPRC